MTQTLVGFNQNGIVMAADSRATRFDEQGGKKFFSLQKLFPLGRYAGLVSGGSGFSIPLSRLLCQEVRRRGLLLIEDILHLAVPFLSAKYQNFLTFYGPEPREDLRRLNFIIAGCSLEGPDPYQIYLVESEKNALPFKVTPVKPLLVMPRNLGMEINLFHALRNGSCIGSLTRLCQKFLEKISNLQDEVGPPFHFAIINPTGFRSVNPPVMPELEHSISSLARMQLHQ